MWRNWQTRWIQNPVPVKGVSVRPRSPVLNSVLEHLREAYRTSKPCSISFFVCPNLTVLSLECQRVQKKVGIEPNLTELLLYQRLLTK